MVSWNIFFSQLFLYFFSSSCPSLFCSPDCSFLLIFRVGLSFWLGWGRQSVLMYANEANRNQFKWYEEQKATKRFQLNDEQNQLMIVKYKYYADWIYTHTYCARLRSFHSLWFCLHSIIIIWNLQSIFMLTIWRHVDHLSFQFLFISHFLYISQLVKFCKSLYSNYSDFSYQTDSGAQSNDMRFICEVFYAAVPHVICTKKIDYLNWKTVR